MSDPGEGHPKDMPTRLEPVFLRGTCSSGRQGRQKRRGEGKTRLQTTTSRRLPLQQILQNIQGLKRRRRTTGIGGASHDQIRAHQRGRRRIAGTDCERGTACLRCFQQLAYTSWRDLFHMKYMKTVFYRERVRKRDQDPTEE